MKAKEVPSLRRLRLMQSDFKLVSQCRRAEFSRECSNKCVKNELCVNTALCCSLVIYEKSFLEKRLSKRPCSHSVLRLS